jgi:hypothetical protein
MKLFDITVEPDADSLTCYIRVKSIDSMLLKFWVRGFVLPDEIQADGVRVALYMAVANSVVEEEISEPYRNHLIGLNEGVIIKEHFVDKQDLTIFLSHFQSALRTLADSYNRFLTHKTIATVPTRNGYKITGYTSSTNRTIKDFVINESLN